MTQNEKDLLLKDLCARLPYNVKLLIPSWDEREMEYIDRVDVLYSVNGDNYIQTVSEDCNFSVEDVKPYLFPLSSMTDEQVKEYNAMYEENRYSWRENIIDWFNKNHFDYRGLIEKGLAIDATGLNIY